MNSTHSHITIDVTTGFFDGYAWGENVGWIHFKNAVPGYGVRKGIDDPSSYNYLLWTK